MQKLEILEMIESTFATYCRNYQQGKKMVCSPEGILDNVQYHFLKANLLDGLKSVIFVCVYFYSRITHTPQYIVLNRFIQKYKLEEIRNEITPVGAEPPQEIIDSMEDYILKGERNGK